MAHVLRSYSRLAIWLAVTGAIPSAVAASRSDYLSDAMNATDVLNQQWYDASKGLYQNLWWNSANALTSLADLASINKDQFLSTANYYLSTSLSAAPKTNGGSFLNTYYDDEGWWAMAWIRAYDVTGNSQYLDTAKTIFKDMITGQGATCGGQWWSKDKQYVASIANELFIEVAASLANRAGNDGTDYRSYAQNELDWFLKSGLINSDNTINDGIDISTCKPTGTVFTYNQGVILGALVEMHKLTNDQSHLDTANRIAGGALAHLVDSNGILTEPGYPGPPDNTSAQFKGVFARNLAELQAVSPNDQYVQFLQKNADSIWKSDRQGDGQIGPDWQGPYYDASMATQSSALDCVIAAAKVSS